MFSLTRVCFNAVKKANMAGIALRALILPRDMDGIVFALIL